jgi:uncharacterized protein YuzE
MTGLRCTTLSQTADTSRGFHEAYYYEDTDSLYIDLSPTASTDSKEIADGLVVDFDGAVHIVGIDIQHASQRIDLSFIESKHLLLITSIA